MRIVREEATTTVRNLAVRYFLRNDDGSELWSEEPEVMVFRPYVSVAGGLGGVLLGGLWPMLRDSRLVNEMLMYAFSDFDRLRSERELEPRPAITEPAREVRP
jgi:hypothetical protein